MSGNATWVTDNNGIANRAINLDGSPLTYIKFLTNHTFWNKWVGMTIWIKVNDLNTTDRAIFGQVNKIDNIKMIYTL